MGVLSTLAEFAEPGEPYVIAVVLALGMAAVMAAAARRGGRVSVRGSWALAAFYACIALWQAEHVVEWCVTTPPLAFTAIRLLLWGALWATAVGHLLWRRAHPEI